MNTISITYDLKWQHKEHYYYQLSTCGKLFNTRTGRRLKKTVNGRSSGFWIKGKFTTLSILKNNLILIPKSEIPF